MHFPILENKITTLQQCHQEYAYWETNSNA